MRLRFTIVWLLAIVSWSVPRASAEEFDKEGLEFFEKRIRPVLVDHCYRCHSEKAETVEAGLYVDSREGLLEGGDQGPAMEPGHPERSLLITAVKYEMEDLKMPPDKRLDDQQIKDLEKWIKMGAPDPRKPGKSDSETPRKGSGNKGRQVQSDSRAIGIDAKSFPRSSPSHGRIMVSGR